MAGPIDVVALLRKYGEIIRLRTAQHATPDVDPREAMAALASEFPGALREADELPMTALTSRYAELERVVRGETAPAPWMETMSRFHRLVRGALTAKRWLGGRKMAGDDARQAFLGDLRNLPYPEDAQLWADALPTLATPSRGRLTDVVFRRMAAEGGVDVHSIRAEVFAPKAKSGGTPGSTH